MVQNYLITVFKPSNYPSFGLINPNKIIKCIINQTFQITNHHFNHLTKLFSYSLTAKMYEKSFWHYH